MKFILQKVFDKGTAEPFFARMMIQILKMRDFVFPIEKERLEFDVYYSPILNNLVECRNAKVNCEKLINEHNMKIESGEIISFQEHTIDVKESIDIELNKNFKDFFIKGKISLQSLIRLSKYLGYFISFFLKEEKKFKEESKGFLIKHTGEKYGNFIKMLENDRTNWYMNFNNIRNMIEHEGFNLPKIIYNADKDNKVVTCFPIIDNKPLKEVINLFWNNLWEFIEDTIVLLLSFKLRQPIELGWIPEDERDPSCPIKYKLSIDARYIK